MVGVLTNSVPMAVFGPGTLYVTRNDIADQTPVNIGYAQEFSYDEAADAKELYGQNQYPLVIARGTIKASGKIKAATVSGLALNAVYTGGEFATGSLRMAQREAQTVQDVVTINTSAQTTSGTTLTFAATTGVVDGVLVSGHANIPEGTFVVSHTGTTVTISQAVLGTVPNSESIDFSAHVIPDEVAKFEQDLGVLSASTGLPYSKAAEGDNPTTGQYTIDPTTNVYSFHSSAADAEVFLTYAYEESAIGQTLLVQNTPIGTTPSFQIDYVSELMGKPYYLRFFACISNKLGRSHKLTDFVMPEIDFAFYAKANGDVYQISYPEVS